jgi:hypothetical protein
MILYLEANKTNMSTWKTPVVKNLTNSINIYTESRQLMRSEEP